MALNLNFLITSFSSERYEAVKVEVVRILIELAYEALRLELSSTSPCLSASFARELFILQL